MDEANFNQIETAEKSGVSKSRISVEKTVDTRPLKTAISVHFLSSSSMWHKNSYFFLMLSPFSSKRMAVCTILSKIASAAVVFAPSISYQLATGN